MFGGASVAFLIRMKYMNIFSHIQRSPMDEEETFEKELRPEDIILDEDAPYESEEEHAEARPKEKPVGPPLELEIPLRHPPADPDQVYLLFCLHLQPTSLVSAIFYDF